MKALSRTQSRLFVVAFLAMLIGLSVFATVMITRGWNNQGLQQRVQQQEAERNAQEPRL